MNKFYFKNNKALSLLEILLTLIILSIAASVVLPVSKIYIVSQREEILKKNLENVRTAIDKYYTKNSKYPTSIDELLENKYLRRLDPEPFGNNWQYKPYSGTHEWKDFIITIQTDKPYLASINYLSHIAQDSDEIYDFRTSTNYTSINGTLYNTW